MSPYLEQLLERFVAARVKDGDLAEQAARGACDAYEVYGADRDEFVYRYALHSVRADRVQDLSLAAVATRPSGVGR